MIRLNNKSKQIYKMKMTEHPISRADETPMPLGIDIDKEGASPRDIEATKKHVRYSESNMVILKPGINEFKNDEQAEYFYRELGNPEEPEHDRARGIIVKNENFLIEIDKDDKEVTDNLYKKYRKRNVNLSFSQADSDNFQVKQ